LLHGMLPEVVPSPKISSPSVSFNRDEQRARRDYIVLRVVVGEKGKGCIVRLHAERLALPVLTR
jgi:hypothetical protein